MLTQPTATLIFSNQLNVYKHAKETVYLIHYEAHGSLLQFRILKTDKFHDFSFAIFGQISMKPAIVPLKPAKIPKSLCHSLYLQCHCAFQPLHIKASQPVLSQPQLVTPVGYSEGLSYPYFAIWADYRPRAVENIINISVLRI